MTFKPVKLRKTSMNRRLERGLKMLDEMSLLEHIELMVRAKLMTPEEAEETKNRMTPEQLAARLPQREEADHKEPTPSA